MFFSSFIRVQVARAIYNLHRAAVHCKLGILRKYPSKYSIVFLGILRAGNTQDRQYRAY